MKRLLIATGAVLLLFTFSEYGNAQMGPNRGMGKGMHKGCPGKRKHHGPPKDGMFFGNPMHLKRMINLSDKQQERIGEINVKFRVKMLDYKKQMIPRKHQLRKLIHSKNVNLTKIRSKLIEISNINVEIKLLKIKHWLAVEKVLTPEQKATLKKRHRRKFR